MRQAIRIIFIIMIVQSILIKTTGQYTFTLKIVSLVIGIIGLILTYLYGGKKKEFKATESTKEKE